MPRAKTPPDPIEPSEDVDPENDEPVLNEDIERQNKRIDKAITTKRTMDRATLVTMKPDERFVYWKREYATEDAKLRIERLSPDPANWERVQLSGYPDLDGLISDIQWDKAHGQKGLFRVTLFRANGHRKDSFEIPIPEHLEAMAAYRAKQQAVLAAPAQVPGKTLDDTQAALTMQMMVKRLEQLERGTSPVQPEETVDMNAVPASLPKPPDGYTWQIADGKVTMVPLPAGAQPPPPAVQPTPQSFTPPPGYEIRKIEPPPPPPPPPSAKDIAEAVALAVAGAIKPLVDQQHPPVQAVVPQSAPAAPQPPAPQQYVAPPGYRLVPEAPPGYKLVPEGEPQPVPATAVIETRAVNPFDAAAGAVQGVKKTLGALNDLAEAAGVLNPKAGETAGGSAVGHAPPQEPLVPVSANGATLFFDPKTNQPAPFWMNMFLNQAGVVDTVGKLLDKGKETLTSTLQEFNESQRLQIQKLQAMERVTHQQEQIEARRRQQAVEQSRLPEVATQTNGSPPIETAASVSLPVEVAEEACEHAPEPTALEPSHEQRSLQSIAAQTIAF